MALCTALYEQQITVVGFGAFNDVTFIRLVTINANNEKQDILTFFKLLEAFADKTPSLARKLEVIQ